LTWTLCVTAGYVNSGEPFDQFTDPAVLAQSVQSQADGFVEAFGKLPQWCAKRRRCPGKVTRQHYRWGTYEIASDSHSTLRLG
jgi:hypothetical protein